MNIKIKGFITSKDSELYSDCADNYAVNKLEHKFAISDGVSKSFFPKIWSEILVNQYVNQNDLKDEDFIVRCQNEWQFKIDEIVKLPDTKWHTRTLYNRKEPALATFVGLQFNESNQKWFAHALGDSFLFFILKDTYKINIQLSSKPVPVVFDNFPDYLSSIGCFHKGEKKSEIGKKIEYGTFYLMTDALAEWFIQDTKHAISILNHINNQDEFLKMIEGERNSKLLNDDDSAILIIDIIDDNKKEFTYSEENVTYLSQLIKREEVKIEESKKKEISLKVSSSSSEIKNDINNELENASSINEDSTNVDYNYSLSSEAHDQPKKDELKNTSDIVESSKSSTLSSENSVSQELYTKNEVENVLYDNAKSSETENLKLIPSEDQENLKANDLESELTCNVNSKVSESFQENNAKDDNQQIKEESPNNVESSDSNNLKEVNAEVQYNYTKEEIESSGNLESNDSNIKSISDKF